MAFSEGPVSITRLHQSHGIVFSSVEDQPVAAGAAVENVKPAIGEDVVDHIGQEVRAIIVGTAAAAVAQVFHSGSKGVGAVPLGKHVAPEILVASGRAAVFSGGAGHKDV